MNKYPLELIEAKSPIDVEKPKSLGGLDSLSSEHMYWSPINLPLSVTIGLGESVSSRREYTGLFELSAGEKAAWDVEIEEFIKTICEKSSNQTLSFFTH